MTTQELQISDGSSEIESRLLDRAISLGSVHWEVLLYVALVLLNLLTHLWGLGYMAYHHDESIHAWTSWKFFTNNFSDVACGLVTDEGIGSSGKSFTYCYDPVYHGPTLYILTYISYFLFGVSDFTARIPMALAGVGLVASSWMLRPLIGKRASLLSAIFMTISPTILYFTRFARHDALILLWGFWFFVGLFRYFQDHKPKWLYLSAAGLALAWATHELVFILLFIIVCFFIVRFLFEIYPIKGWTLGLLVLMAFLLIPMYAGVVKPKYGGVAMLLFMVCVSALLSSRIWGSDHVIHKRFALILNDTHEYRVWVKALLVFLAVFAVNFTVFFTHPMGFFDGFYVGLAYWFGSQQEFRRGAQPWFYYLMFLPVYEPAVLLLSLGGIFWRLRQFFPNATGDIGAIGEPKKGKANTQIEVLDFAVDNDLPANYVAPVFQAFLFFWVILSLFAFGWAGEKMPWLIVHMTLPLILTGSLVLDRMLRRVDWAAVKLANGWQIPLLFFLVPLAGVLFSTELPGQEGTSPRTIAGIILVLFAAFFLYQHLTRLGVLTVLRVAGLAFVFLLTLYTVRSMIIGVYRQPDVPRELLVYVQTSPNVPLIAEQIKAISKNLTTNERNSNDEDGGNNLRIMLSSGSSEDGGDGSLAWPMEWYLRDYPNRDYVDSKDLSNPTQETFMRDGKFDPILLLHKPAVTDATKSALSQAGYVLTADSVFNWWFPEQSIGYKDRLYDTEAGCKSVEEVDAGANPEVVSQKSGEGAYNCPSYAISSIFGWIFRTHKDSTGVEQSNFKTAWDYLIWRDLPEGANINGREMLVYMHCTVAPLPTGGCKNGGTGAGSSRGGEIRLVAERLLGSGKLTEPRGLAISPNGKLYVVDTAANKVLILPNVNSPVTPELQPINNTKPFNEATGIAVDSKGNIYVANTWAGTIDKFDAQGKYVKSWGEPTGTMGTDQMITQTDGTPEDNQAKPLGFFGPRGVAVDKQDHIYITDTGNKRVVVTDSDGKYIYQWGTPGAGIGQFDEPVGIAIGPDGRVYVGDTWNSRVQIFNINSDTNQVDPASAQSIPINGWSRSSYNNPFIAVSPTNLLAVAVPEKQQIYLFDSVTGKQLITWGGTGTDDASLNMPSGLAFDDKGLLYVAERMNQRVSVFMPPRVR